MEDIYRRKKVPLSKGVFIPVVTPFDESEKLSVDMIEHNISLWNLTDVAGYMCLGSNGEFHMLDEEETWEVLCTYSKFHGKKQVIAGVGRESLYHTKKLIDKMQDAELEFDGIAVLTPSYFRKAMDDTALIQFYLDVAEFSKYPVLLYCAPGFANDVVVSGKALRELSMHPNIIGIKDTSSNMMKIYMEEVGEKEDFCIVAGTFGNIYECLSNGGSRAVLSSANYFPEKCAHLLQVWNKDSQELFIEQYNELKNLIEKTGGTHGVSSIKYCMNLRGFQAGIPRRPLCPLTKHQEKKIKIAFEKEIDRID